MVAAGEAAPGIGGGTGARELVEEPQRRIQRRRARWRPPASALRGQRGGLCRCPSGGSRGSGRPGGAARAGHGSGVREGRGWWRGGGGRGGRRRRRGGGGVRPVTVGASGWG
ncbi:uncharacterized protein [Miscanthus floridulus]|uniref:uncharacterized protein n=1 Tax=Miscanthus floridulus TaxID=154761 RepID=UPI00345A62E3